METPGEQIRAVWDSTELSIDFEVLGFMAPYVVVRKSDGRKSGVSASSALLFQLRPRPLTALAHHHDNFWGDWRRPDYAHDLRSEIHRGRLFSIVYHGVT
jgi:hypothetical protein